MRAQPVQATLKPPARAMGASSRARTAPQHASRAAAAAQLASVRSAVAAAVSAIVGAEVCDCLLQFLLHV